MSPFKKSKVLLLNIFRKALKSRVNPKRIRYRNIIKWNISHQLFSSFSKHCNNLTRLRKRSFTLQSIKSRFLKQTMIFFSYKKKFRIFGFLFVRRSWDKWKKLLKKNSVFI